MDNIQKKCAFIDSQFLRYLCKWQKSETSQLPIDIEADYVTLGNLLCNKCKGDNPKSSQENGREMVILREIVIV